MNIKSNRSGYHYHFNQRWLRWTDGLTVWGRVVYFRKSLAQTSSGLFRHEMTHVRQRRRLCVFGWWWTGSVAWLAAYGAMWLWSAIACLWQMRHRCFWRCAYENVRYEREAYRAQHGVAWRPAYRVRRR